MPIKLTLKKPTVSPPVTAATPVPIAVAAVGSPSVLPKLTLKLKPGVAKPVYKTSSSKMPRGTGSKPYNTNTWTEARFRQFITSQLRSATGKWGPRIKCKIAARTKRGFYRCAECKQEVPATIKPPGAKRRINNAIVDHIDPVIDPAQGFVGWDTYIDRMFCELDGLQLLCHSCHMTKTAEERVVAMERRRGKL